MKKDFYITQDKLHIWRRFFLFMLAVCALMIWYAWDGTITTLLKSTLAPLVFLLLAGANHTYKISRPALSLETSYVRIQNKKYSYKEIESFWIGKDVVRRIGMRHSSGPMGGIVIVEKMLFIAIKNKLLPYRFDLDNNFSRQAGTEILDTLRINKVPEKVGNSHPIIRALGELGYVIGCLALFMLITLAFEKLFHHI